MPKWQPVLFISYAHADQNIARRLARALRDQGLTIWIDDDEILGGARWTQEIVNAIFAAKAVLLIASSRSLVRDTVQKEICLASEEKKPILPCFTEATKIPSTIRYQLADRQRLDLYQLPSKEWVRVILVSLARLGFDVVPTKQGRERSPTAALQLEGIELSHARLLSMSQSEIRSQIEEYKQVLELKPDQGHAHLNLGLIYLHMRAHSAAISHFRAACRSMPESPDAYYFLALSLCGGQRPGKLTRPKIAEIEETLRSAISLDETKAAYHYLLALIAHDYYLSNGLIFHGPGPDELIAAAKQGNHDPDEVARLLYSVPTKSTTLRAAIESC